MTYLNPANNNANMAQLIAQAGLNTVATPTIQIPYQFQMPTQTYSTANTIPGLSNPVYGISQMGIQSHMPVQKNRPLTVGEKVEIDRASQRWWPVLTTHYGSSPTALMAHPVKKGILNGLLSAGVLGGLGLLLGRAFAGGEGYFIMGDEAKVAAAKAARKATLKKGGRIGLYIGLGLGLLSGIGAGLGQARKNGTYAELMSRFPEGADVRDILSDSAYQAGLTRSAMRSR